MPEFVIEGSAYCSRCRRWLSRDSFRANPAMLSGLHPWCRDCVSSYMREWPEANPAYIERKNREAREAYRAARGDMSRTCVNPDCRKRFVASRADQRSCSAACRDHAAYLRRRGRA